MSQNRHTPRREVRWERMFPDELERAFQECPLLYLTYGLCEPHGPHNAVGLDAIKAHAIACRAALAHGGIVAPPDFWHIHEIGGFGRWAYRCVGEIKRNWTTAVPPWVHFRNVCYQIRTADAMGFHAVILFTGHYGPNWKDLKKLVSILQPHVGARMYALPESEANVPGFDGDGASGDHAGKVETSLLWALEPESVDLSRMPPPEAQGTFWAMGQSARQASRRIGERMVEDEVRWLGEKASELLAEYDRIRPSARLRTFAQTERLWSEVVMPELKSFESMKEGWPGQPDVPPNSVWAANLPVPDRYA